MHLNRLITTLNVVGDTVATRAVEAIVSRKVKNDIENNSSVAFNTSQSNW